MRSTLPVEEARPPRFLGDPNAYVPRSQTPAGPYCQARLRQLGVAFRSMNPVGSREIHVSRLDAAARRLAVYA